MKKIGLLVILVLTIFMITGCISNKSKNLTCTLEKEIIPGAKMENTYIVTYQGNNVTVVKTVERITSDNDTYLETVKTTAEGIYDSFRNIKYYDYHIELKDNTLLSTTNIDYSKINYDELIKANPSIASIMKNKKLKVKDIKRLYESEEIGATCQ